jgi:hypothetical protein
VLLAGDWNEFQWEDNNCRQPYYNVTCRQEAAARMSGLWTGYFGGSARDVVPNHTVSGASAGHSHCRVRVLPLSRRTRLAALR